MLFQFIITFTIFPFKDTLVFKGEALILSMVSSFCIRSSAFFFASGIVDTSSGLLITVDMSEMCICPFTVRKSVMLKSDKTRHSYKLRNLLN